VNRWYPVARSEELVPRHIAQTQLLGQEIALWRDDAGAVNAWENRCPHRGVRLSIGSNTGTDLRCRYHGFRFAAGSGRCNFIPAHPSQKPAGSMHAVVYAAVERYRYVCVSLDPRTDEPELPMPGNAAATSLRSIFVEAPAAAVVDQLSRGYRIDAATEAVLTGEDHFTLTAAAGSGERAQVVLFLLQPVTQTQTVIHALLCPAAAAADRLAVLRHHNAQMTMLRDAVERSCAAAKRRA